MDISDFFLILVMQQPQFKLGLSLQGNVLLRAVKATVNTLKGENFVLGIF